MSSRVPESLLRRGPRRGGVAVGRGRLDLISLLGLLGLLGSSAWFQVAGHGAESGALPPREVPVAPDAPQPERFEPLLRHSPFQRVLKPEETYELRGVARFGSDSVATLYNRDTGETVQVRGGGERDASAPSDKPRLIEVREGEALGEVSVRIAMGGQEVVLKYDPERVAPPVRDRPRYEVKYDSRGRPIPPKELIDKYRAMTDEQRKRYMRWRETYYKARPKLKDSAERFPIVDQAIEAIRAGQEPPRP